ncbi:unnamed protein product [Mycena citricolor]|uniref:Uncharacterized protein n=1 Tax=Mycena citricolor TaxID=2018698 RepID=A0AAD2HI43_9AGAR|nr:unnamed protein product [Mycena citricolor]
MLANFPSVDMLTNFPSVDFSTGLRIKPKAEPKKQTAPVLDSVNAVTRTTISLEYAPCNTETTARWASEPRRSAPDLYSPDAARHVRRSLSGLAVNLGRSLLRAPRLLLGRDLQVPTHVPGELPRQPACGAVRDGRRVPPAHLAEVGDLQSGAALPAVAVSVTYVWYLDWIELNCIDVLHRPKEHHIFDVLHWIKAAFKKHALDEIKEADCLNKEAYRYHESTSSFAGLAAQSSSLSQSAPALFDRDHQSLKGQPRDAMPFVELPNQILQEHRSKLGLSEWLEIKS